MATNDFLAFANSETATVITQAEYAALTQFVQGGFGSDIVLAERFNKVLRQSSAMAHGVGEIIKNNGIDALDDGTSLASKIIQALALQFRGGIAYFKTAGAWTWTVPANVYTVDARIWGAGANGSSAGTDPRTLKTGASGAYSFKRIAVTPGDTISGAISAVGGANTTLNHAGSSTAMSANSGAADAGGVATGGLINIPGSNGVGVTLQTGQIPTTTLVAACGPGAPFGGAGGTAVQGSGVTVSAAWPGGGGAISSTTGGAGLGAVGGVILTW